MHGELERAVRAGDAAAVEALADAGVDLHSRNAKGQTALMLAAKLGHRDVVAVVIRRGIDLNASAKYHLTALMLAVINNHDEIARLLAEAGADLSRRGSGAPGFFGKTAYDLAYERGKTELARLLRADVETGRGETGR
jgi:ankyrin repeat protein